MKKTLLAICMAVIMLVSLALPASAATGNLSVTAKLLEDGTSFTVELNVKNNPGIIAMTAEASYDSSVLKLKSAENGEIFESIFMPSQNLTVNPYKLIWMDATASEDIKTDGLLATYTFEVLNSAAIGQTEIKFNIVETVNYKKDDTSNFNGCKFTVNVKGSANESEKVSSNEAGTNNGTFSDAVTDNETLIVQKPVGDGTSTETVSDESTDSVTEEVSSDTSNEEISDATSDETEQENKDRTLATALTIGAVLIVGICITLVALYFRKKTGSYKDKE